MQYLNTLFVLAATALLGAHATSSCPQDNGRRFNGLNGEQFQMHCSSDINPGSQDLAVNYKASTDYVSCAISCDTYNNDGRLPMCTGAVWREDQNNCYLKGGSTNIHYSQNAEAIVKPDN